MLFKRCLLFQMVFCALLLSAQQKTATITIHYRPGQTAFTLLPLTSLGVAYDGHEQGENELILQPKNIKAMLSVGMKPLSYRLRTELANEAWHWNPKGYWSDAAKSQGYWTSSSDTASYIPLSYGYKLPRRGNTMDQANDDGYSRIDDGDTNSFWKSNPYLDKYFTNESNQQHAQWVIIDLGKEEWINAIRVHWGLPYAISYTLDYATKDLYNYFENAGYFEIDPSQFWKPFPNRNINNQTRKNEVIKLSDDLMKVRFLRIRMEESSYTAPLGSSDIRDSLGFAIKEIYVGRIDKKEFRDLIKHSNNNKHQSKIYVSTTDPWHRAMDKDSLTEQLGIDRLYQSGLNSQMPALLSAGILYDTPDNTMSLLNYVHQKKYPIAGIELGEEPDGQMVSAKDDAALYCQWAKKIHQYFPSLSIGGPSLQDIIPNQFDEPFPTQKWMQGFVNYLHQHNNQNLFNFCSFEWYPFDSVCAASAPQLARAPYMLQEAIKDMKNIKGLDTLPFFMTEYGYSAFSGVSEVSMQGALMNADIVGQFLTLGGSKAFLYGWEPASLQCDFGCDAGNNMLFGMDDDGEIMYHTATYYAAQLLSKQWAIPANKTISIYPAFSDVFNKNGEQLVTAYALRSADSTWSLLLINKDPLKAYKLRVEVKDEKNGVIGSLKFPAVCFQYSGKQYQWKSSGLNGHPVKNLPPEKKLIEKEKLIVPPYSLTIIRGKIISVKKHNYQ
jgi:hypothetical protein